MIGKFLSNLVNVMFNNNLLVGRLHCFDWVQPCRVKGSSTSCTDLTITQQWHCKIIPTGGVAVISLCLLMDISPGIASLTGDPTLCPQLMSSLSLFMRVILSSSELFRRRGNFFFTFITGAHADSIYFSSTAAFSAVRFGFFSPILVWLNLFALNKLKLAILTIF